MKYLFIINPAAGKGQLQTELANKIHAHFKENPADYEIVETRFAGHGEQVARDAAKSGERIRIFACGGEGTSYEVLNGIVGCENVEMGVIPCGSANDFLKYFGQKDCFLDIGAQITGKAFTIDLIRAGDRYCINGCSAGMDAMVARDMSIFKHWPLVSGKLAYKLAIARNFFKIRLGVRLDLSLDGKPIGKKDCLFAVAANAPYYGGGYKGAPTAVPNDGSLDFTLVNTISHLKVPGFLKYYEKGEFESFDYCTTARIKSMSFTADRPVPVNMDGEIIETASMTFSVAENALRFVIPAGIDTEKFAEKNQVLKNR